MAVARSTLRGARSQKWVSGTTYALDAIAWSPTSKLEYVRIVAGAGTTDPASDSTNWAVFGPTRMKSVQRGTVSMAGGVTSVVATIVAVVAEKTRIRVLGVQGSTTTDNAEVGLKVELTSATGITLSRGTSATAIQITIEVNEDY